jgi:hypothetical protein
VTSWVTRVTAGVCPALYWAKTRNVQIRKIIQRRIRHSSENVDFAGDVNAAISANVGERSSTSHVSSRSRVSAESAGQRKGERRDKADEPGREGT